MYVFNLERYTNTFYPPNAYVRNVTPKMDNSLAGMWSRTSASRFEIAILLGALLLLVSKMNSQKHARLTS